MTFLRRLTRRSVPAALLALTACLGAPPATAFQSAVHVYPSSVDGVSLIMSVVYPDTARGCPILAVMHGYSGGMQEVFQTQILLAERGLFTVAPSMRGRNNSGGSADDGGWELTDILDAIETVKTLYAGVVDAGNVNLIGFSGGGGNTFGCMSKFPDAFRLAAEFFGMSDYGYDPIHGWYHYGGEGVQPTLRARIGGAPEDVPDRYMARNSLLAVENCRRTAFHLFVDSAETTCPPYNDTTYARIALDAGLTNVALHVSTPDSLYRWLHGYPSQVPDLLQGIDRLLPGIFAGSYPAPAIEPAGDFTVLGYLRTAAFTIVPADGLSEVADLTYDISGTATTPQDAWSFALTSRTGPVSTLRLTLRGLAPSATYWVEDADVTHGTQHETLVDTDAAGVLSYATVLDTVSSIRVYRADTQGVEDLPSGTRVTTFPNPCRGQLTILLRAPAAQSPRLVDVSGRTIAVLGRPAVSGERCVWRWDGTDSGGAAAPNGVYYFVLGAGSARSVSHIALAR
jgi:hypothetical protein